MAFVKGKRGNIHFNDSPFCYYQNNLSSGGRTPAKRR